MKIVLLVAFSIILGGITLSAYGDSVEEMHGLAFEFMREGNFDGAVQLYSKILDVDKKDENALLNRAVAFAQIGDTASSLSDFSKVLENNPNNLFALKGKATVLADFDCKSYDECGPLEALHLFETAMEIKPNDEEIKMKRDYVLSLVREFDVHDTNGDYIVNIQLITRDNNGTLVSIIENSGTDIFPSKILDEFLDKKETSAINFKKEIVNIGQDKYIKWHYEAVESEENRKFFGSIIFEEVISTKTPEGENLKIKIELLRAITPAQNVDYGDTTLQIVEIFKRI